METGTPDLLETRRYVGHAARRPSGLAFGYAGGLPFFLTTRSCVEGSQKFASAWLSISSSIGVCGVSPSSHPERLSGRGFAPLSGWRATLSPSSSNIAR